MSEAPPGPPNHPAPNSLAHSIHRHGSSFALVLAVLAIVAVLVTSGGALGLGVLVTEHHHHGGGGWGGANSSEYEFAALPGAASIAVSPAGLFATTQQTSTSNCTAVWAVTPSGNVSLYATLPLSVSLCGEGSVALAPPGWGSPPVVQTAPFRTTEETTAGAITADLHGRDCPCISPQAPAPPDTLWDIQEGQLFEISQGGAQVTHFANLSTAHSNVDYGLTYDATGDFGHNLVVTSSAGRVWTVNQTGAITLIVDLATHLEDPAVAPSSFGAYSGDLFVADSPTGSALAIAPNGTHVNVTGWHGSESVAFPTGRGCTFGGSSAVLLVANETLGGIDAFPAGYFSTLRNIGFLDSESNAGIGSFTSNGTGSTIAAHGGHLEELAAVACLGSGVVSNSSASGRLGSYGG